LRRLTQEAAASAVAGEDQDEGTEGTEATSKEIATSDASTEGEQSASSTEDSTDSEASDGTEDGPTEYFGYKLPPELTPQERVELLSELQKRDDTIGKLLRGKEAATTETVVETPAVVEPLTDAEILQALGLDPENPFDEQTAKAVVPLVRKQLEQDNVIAQLIEIQELNEIDRSWRGTLSSLEKEFGALPAEVDHEAVMEFAADNNISSPVDAYWRIAGPGRSLVESVMAERAKKLTAAKAASATTRPGGAGASDEAPLESKTTKGATREAAAKLLQSLGLNG
jgi:hypothetical protein